MTGKGKRRFFLATPILGVALLAGTALAASVHFKSGPTFSTTDLTLTTDACLAGLGNGDLVINVSATGIPTATCTNKGGEQAPGQNPATVNVSGTQAIPSSEIKNGNVCFSVTTQPPPQPTAQEAGCPNGNWTAQITSIDFTSVTIQVIQSGTTVLDQTFTP